MNCESDKYEKLIKNITNYIITEVRVKIDNKLQPLIDEINNDNCILNEMTMINNLVKQFPIFQRLEENRRLVFDENILLKEKLSSIEENKLQLCIKDIDKLPEPNNSNIMNSKFKILKLLMILIQAFITLI